MQNVIYLLRKFSFIFLFLLFEAIAFALIFRRSYFQRVAILNSTNEITGRIYSGYSNTWSFIYLRKENDLLAKENARLMALVQSSQKRYYQSQTLKGDTVFEQQYEYIPCRVINNSVRNTKNYFTIDAGRRHGIRTDMAIVSPGGIAGVVKGVSDNFAVCISVLNPDLPVSVQLRNSKYYGTLTWKGGSPRYATVSGISSHVPLEKGDTLESTGFSHIFPEGIMAGVVNEFTIDPDDGSYVIRLELSTPFQALRHVFAVDYIFKKEQQALEDSLAVQ